MPPGSDDGESAGVRVLVVALVVQAVVAAVVIFFAVNGWPWINDPPATSAAGCGPAPSGSMVVSSKMELFMPPPTHRPRHTGPV